MNSCLSSQQLETKGIYDIPFCLLCVTNSVDAFDIIGLTLAANDKKIIGSTTLQKLIYFETITIPNEIKLDEPYIAYFYGPFNRDVARSLEQMVFYDILDERRIGIDCKSYVYTVTQKGTQTIDRLESKFKQTLERIKELIYTCDKYCKLEPKSLSFAAKVHYMFHSQKSEIKTMSENDFVQMGKSFDWQISKSDIKNGFELLEKLKLVNIQR